LLNTPDFDTLLQQSVSRLQAADVLGARRWLAASLRVAPQNEYQTALLCAALGSQAGREQLDVLRAAIALFPDSTLLMTQYWRALAAQRSELSSEDVVTQIRHRLSWLDANTGPELVALAKLMRVLRGGDTSGHAQLGYCRYDPVGKRVLGWAIDLDTPNRACQLSISTQDTAGNIIEGRLSANAPHALIKAARFSATVGGFEIRLPGYLPCLRISFDDGEPLVGSPLAAIEPMTIGMSAAVGLGDTAAPKHHDQRVGVNSVSSGNSVGFIWEHHVVRGAPR